MKESFEPLRPEESALKKEGHSDVHPEGFESDEPVIDLTDIAEEISEAKSEAAEDSSEVIIDLTDIVREENPPLDDMITSEIEDGHEADEDDFAEALGMELEESAHSSSVAPKQVEEAIDRVVREMLSKKIDDLLMKVIEREVSKELERIRKLLLEELPDSDHF